MTSLPTIHLSTSSTFSSEGETSLLAKVTPPAGSERSPVDVVCVIDTSYSMSDEATMANDTAKKESSGLNLLDVVKHAVTTVIEVLGEKDRISLVSFSAGARIVLPMTKMNKKGKSKAKKDLQSLQPDANTNLWAGLLAGMEMLRTNPREGAFSSVMLLTDGVPNVDPPGGHIGALNAYKDQHENLNFSVSTFGFGYNLDSALLNEIAELCDGSYAFIPDAGFVGTTFVNATTNLLTTYARNLQLDLELTGGQLKVDGDVLKAGGDRFPTEKTSWGVSTRVSTLHYGQDRDIVFTITGTLTEVAATVKFHTASGAQASVLQEELEPENVDEMAYHHSRQEFVELEPTLRASNPVIIKSVKSIIERLESRSGKDERLLDLLKDVQGQVLEAVEEGTYMNKWGRHYLPSLARAHALQQCNNFKDPGVQHYGGALFQRLRDEADDIFISLPPPKPSIKKSQIKAGYTYSAPTSMSGYYSSSAPCFLGQCTVSLADGSLSPVSQVRAGDRVMTRNGPSTVVCVIETLGNHEKQRIVSTPSGLSLTPYHPVIQNGQWVFPGEVEEWEQSTVTHRSVFSFVLDSNHIMLINDVECVTYGHGFQDAVVKHEFFGTQKIVENLRLMRGWSNGYIQLERGCVVRGPGGLVAGFNPAFERLTTDTQADILLSSGAVELLQSA